MEGRRYYVENPEKIVFEYDQQSDILYIYFTDEEQEADEEILGEDGDTAFRVKQGRILSIMVMNFSRKAGFSPV
ncbi:DUF2283 domain-containing protein [Desulfurococcus mucosus]|uniref:DUF2283 domain-containing protein n=1 Tax=Desulfurococcus mucosus (strain ATCC 35584 / DSM 2162 / JCM 9187 / O7/1) TaxID=765177 RepID=E8RA71_DESM0|nr:DUF2283 domain-containing protein [Desulfurococcus mucosus]ADV65377.1 hypothetical protein Desmu_1075 [Desulfurococcus mucosus DSM 2162]